MLEVPLGKADPNPFLSNGGQESNLPPKYSPADTRENTLPLLEPGHGNCYNNNGGNRHSDDMNESNESNEYNVANEITPLLNSRTSIPHHTILQRMFSPRWWCYFGLPLLITLVTLTCLTFWNIENVINEAIDVQIYGAKLEGLTGSGVAVHLQGSITLNYNTIDNSNAIQRSLLKMGAFMIGFITISSLERVQIHVKLVDVETCPFLYLANVHPPPIKINVRNNSTTVLDILSKCTFEESQFFQFLKYYYQLTGDVLNADVKIIEEKVNIRAWDVISLSLKNVELRDTISIDRSTMRIPHDVTVDRFKVDSADDGTVVRIAADIILSNDLDFALELDSIVWDLMFDNCDEELVKIGSWTTAPFNITQGRPINATVLGEIKSVPSSLMDDCADTVSPITQIVQHYLNGEPIIFYLHINKVVLDRFPPWLLEMLIKIPPVKFEIKIPKFGTFATPKHVALKLMNMVFLENTNANTDSGLELNLQSNCTIQLEEDFPYPIEFKKWVMDFNVSCNEKHIFYAQSGSYVYSSILHEDGFDKFDIKMDDLGVVIVDPRSLGQLVNGIMNNEKSILGATKLFANASLGGLELKLPLIERLILSHLEISQLQVPTKFGVKKMPQKQETVARQLPPLVIDQLNITIEQLYYIESSPNEINFLVELSLFNPSNFSIELPLGTGQKVHIGLVKDDILLGTIGLTKEILLTTQERNELIIELKLEYHSVLEKLHLQDFISNYISSVSLERPKNVTAIELTRNSALNYPSLNNFLQEIELHNLALPNVTFDTPARILDSSKFIIDVTIHILASEVEVTVYNPLANAEVQLEILQSFAKHGEVVLGYIAKRQVLVVPPGIYTTPRIPFKVNNDAARDILRNTLNRDLEIDVLADVNVGVDKFDLRLMYRGVQLISKIRL